MMSEALLLKASLQARLVGIDSDVVLELNSGETVIGRGPILKVTDKRVSRCHAALELKNGILRLCPKHSNPCFSRASERSEFTPLARDKWVELHHGNQISLLPESLRYRVEIIELETRLETREQEVKEQQTGQSKRGQPDLKEQDERHDVGKEQKVTEKEAMSGQEVKQEEDTARRNQEENTHQSSSVVERAGSSGRRRVLPSWLSDVATSTSIALTSQTQKTSTRKDPPKKKRTASTNNGSQATPASTALTSQKQSQQSSTRKSPPKKKMTKTLSTASTENDSQTTPTGGVSVDSAISDPPSVVAGPVNTSDLPPCPYGADCYRKNPAHFREFSHNTVDERPECVYGTACYRKNPDHRRQFKHSGPPASPPAAKRAKYTRPKKHASVLAGDSDDSDAPNTYDYTDSFIDDEELISSDSADDGGGESEDSDWAPPPTREEDAEEDVGELVKEANSFISNKKM